MTNYLKKPLIIGGGQLGQGLREKYPGGELFDFPKVDISDENSVAKIFGEDNFAHFSVILNAAAATQVDKLEYPENANFAKNVNSNGPKILAKFAKKFDIPLVHISSDYVFDGKIANHDENEKFSPLSIYGKTKAAGDENVVNSGAKYYILRSSWVIGKGVSGAKGKGTNFVKIMAELAKNGISPAVANDQIGRETFVSELVRAIDFLLKNDAENGVYNLTNSGKIASLSEITKYIFAKMGRNPSDVKEVSTDEYYFSQGFLRDENLKKYFRENSDGAKDFVAFRPKNSDLNLAKIQRLGFRSEDYFAKIDEYLAELQKEFAEENSAKNNVKKEENL